MTDRAHAEADPLGPKDTGSFRDQMGTIAEGSPSPTLAGPSSIRRLSAAIGNAAVARMMSERSQARESVGWRAPTRTIARSRAEDAATAEADEEREAQAASDPMVVSNINDVSSAQTLLNRLQGDEPGMHEALKQATGENKPRISAEIETNNEVMQDLRTYLGSANVQTMAITNFQKLYGQTLQDFARLDGMMKSLTGSSFESVDVAPLDGDKQAEFDVKALGGQSDLSKEVEQLEGKNPELGKLVKATKTLKGEIDTQAGAVDTAQHNSTIQVSDVSVATHELVGALAEVSADEMRKKFAASKAAAQASEDLLKALLEALWEGGKEGFAKGVEGGPQAGAVAGAKKAGEKVAKDYVWEKLVKPKLEEWNTQANASVGHFPDNTEDVAKTEDDKKIAARAKAAKEKLKNSKDKVITALETFATERRRLEEKKNAYDTKMTELGEALDLAEQKSGKAGVHKSKFSQILGLVKEGEQFVIQADLTSKVGKQELDNRPPKENADKSRTQQASVDLKKVNDAGGRTYYYPYSWKAYHVETKDGKPEEVVTTEGKDKKEVVFWNTRPDHLKINTASSPSNTIGPAPEAQGTGSAETSLNLKGEATNLGANQVITDAIAKTDELSAKVTTYVATLKAKTIGE
jgi:hypothetical protein